MVTAPKKAGVFHHIEFLRLGERRVLLILVSPEGDVQNRVIMTARDHPQAELLEASNYLNSHYAGLTLDAVRERLQHEVEALRGEIAALMQAAVQAGTEAMAETTEQVVVSGERNLLAVQDFGNDMGSLRKLFDLFEQKTQLMRLLDVSTGPKACASISAARAGWCRSRNFRWSAHPMKSTVRWSARWP